MRQFAKFAKTPLYRGYFPNSHLLCYCFPKKSEKNITSTPLTIKIAPLFCHTPFQLFSKKIYLSTGDYRKNCTKRSHPLLLFPKKISSPTGVISKTAPCCVADFVKKSEKTFVHYRGYIQNDTQLCCCFRKKFHKNIISTPLTIKITPHFVTPLFNFFEKFSSTLLTVAKTPCFVSPCFALFPKKLSLFHP